MPFFQSHKLWFGLALGTLGLVLGGVLLVQQWVPWSAPARHVSLAQFTENEVLVEVEVIEYASGQRALVGTFTPLREHFHLYSKDLPKGGVNGLGRPTLLEIISADGIQASGALVANQPENTIYIDTLKLSFPVYPAGPVQLSQTFALTHPEAPTSAELSVTYMACSDTTCLPPVIDKRLVIQIPSTDS